MSRQRLDGFGCIVILMALFVAFILVAAWNYERTVLENSEKCRQRGLVPIRATGPRGSGPVMCIRGAEVP